MRSKTKKAKDLNKKLVQKLLCNNQNILFPFSLFIWDLFFEGCVEREREREREKKRIGTKNLNQI